MKRIWIWVVLALMIAALTIPVAAAPSITLNPSKSTVNAGDTITVKLSVGSATCKAGGVEVSFDSKIFDLVDGKWLLSGTFITEFTPSTKDGVFAFTSATTISGGVAEVTLKVKDTATLGTSNVTMMLNLDGEKTTQSAGITVACKHTYNNGCDTTCNSCGETRTITHNWNSGEVDKKVTCTQDGTKVYTCTVCGEKKTETQNAYGHDYDNACDANCNNCGEKRDITHDYGTKWFTSKDEHWYTCSVCGEKKDAGAHTPGAEATDDTPQTCTACGYVIVPALSHKHSLVREINSDETGHWHTCKDCDLIPDFEEHVFDNECDKECDTCGFKRETEHVYQTQWTSDANGHWHQCEFCGNKLEKELHVPGPDATEFEAQMCTVCGFELTPALHEHKYEWNSDDEKHWQKCSCEDVIEEGEHIWDEGTVTAEPTYTTVGVKEYKCTVCDAVRTENLPILPPQTFREKLMNTVEVPVWMFIAAGGGVILLCILCVVITAEARKKRIGKYCRN